MDNHPYIRFVDTHTEGIGSHDDSHLVLLPGFLALIFYRWQESCMIEGALDAILVEQGGNLLGTFPASGIDDGRAFCASQDMHHLVELIAYGAYDICQVLALKTHFEHILLLEMQFSCMSLTTSGVAVAVRARIGVLGFISLMLAIFK